MGRQEEVELFERRPNNFFGSRINGNVGMAKHLGAMAWRPNNFFGSRINGNGTAVPEAQPQPAQQLLRKSN